MTGPFAVVDSIGWLVLLPIVLVSMGLGALAMSHFCGLMRSLDICLIGLLMRSAVLCIFAFPLAINVTISGECAIVHKFSVMF